MDKLRRTTGGTGGEIIGIHQQRAQSGAGRLAQDARTGNSPTDNQDIPWLTGQLTPEAFSPTRYPHSDPSISPDWIINTAAVLGRSLNQCNILPGFINRHGSRRLRTASR